MTDWPTVLKEIKAAIPNATWKSVANAVEIHPDRIRHIAQAYGGNLPRRKKMEFYHSEGERVLALHSVLVKREPAD